MLFLSCINLSFFNTAQVKVKRVHNCFVTSTPGLIQMHPLFICPHVINAGLSFNRFTSFSRCQYHKYLYFILRRFYSYFCKIDFVNKNTDKMAVKRKYKVYNIAFSTRNCTTELQKFYSRNFFLQKTKNAFLLIQIQSI